MTSTGYFSRTTGHREISSQMYKTKILSLQGNNNAYMPQRDSSQESARGETRTKARSSVRPRLSRTRLSVRTDTTCQQLRFQKVAVPPAPRRRADSERP